MVVDYFEHTRALPGFRLWMLAAERRQPKCITRLVLRCLRKGEEVLL